MKHRFTCTGYSTAWIWLFIVSTPLASIQHWPATTCYAGSKPVGRFTCTALQLVTVCIPILVSNEVLIIVLHYSACSIACYITHTRGQVSYSLAENVLLHGKVVVNDNFSRMWMKAVKLLLKFNLICKHLLAGKKKIAKYLSHYNRSLSWGPKPWPPVALLFYHDRSSLRQNPARNT